MAEVIQLVRRIAELDFSRFDIEKVSPKAMEGYFAEYAAEDGKGVFGFNFNPGPKVSSLVTPMHLCARMTAQLTEWLITNRIAHAFDTKDAFNENGYCSPGILIISDSVSNEVLFSLMPIAGTINFQGFNVIPVKAFNNVFRWNILTDLAVAAAHHNNCSILWDFDYEFFMYQIETRAWLRLIEKPVPPDSELLARIEQGRIKAGRDHEGIQIKGDTSFINGDDSNG